MQGPLSEPSPPQSPRATDGYEIRRVKSAPGMPLDQRNPVHGFDFPEPMQRADTVVVPSEDPAVGPKSPTFRALVGSMMSMLILLSLSSVFCVLFSLFIYFVLMNGYVETPGVVWDASWANYFVGAASIVSVILTNAMLKEFLTTIRPVLAAGELGSSWATWIAQGSSGWLTVLQIAVANRFLNLWCLFRLGLPLLGLGLGSVVKFQTDFAFYFVASAKKLLVYAGLLPLTNMRILEMIAPADLAMFLTAFGVGLLTNTMFALPFAMDGCGSACRSFILPGSITLARQLGPSLNMSIYSTDTLSNITVVRIVNAPGMIVKYDILTEADLRFDIQTECIHAGPQLGNGLQVCFRQDNMSLIAGWSACPKSDLDNKRCTVGSPPPWRTLPIVSGTRMSLYNISATTSYDRISQAIVDMQPLTDPMQLAMSAADYTAIFRAALIPSTKATQADTYVISTLIYFGTWMHRTYSKTFPNDDESPVAMLQNLLAVPIQFSTTAQEYANYSSGLSFPLPDEMITEAQGGRASSRLVIPKWTGWVFIAVDGVVHVVVIFSVATLFIMKRGMPEGRSGITETENILTGEETTVLLMDKVPHWHRPFVRFRGWRRVREVESGNESDKTLIPETAWVEHVKKNKDLYGGGVSVRKIAERNMGVRVKENKKEN
ncbi:hypothetical protein QBC47DRAFT_312218 [Echria macrotheca]|uniref:Uncharacterized protein n=1 Tax=Echria macrotheca TaxID=438768 RepID=A0AAJ0BKN6_9PEZI|nr:hypothetical protein QBC47DRAFT_312218 [Echria macrotheca]